MRQRPRRLSVRAGAPPAASAVSASPARLPAEAAAVEGAAPTAAPPAAAPCAEAEAAHRQQRHAALPWRAYTRLRCGRTPRPSRRAAPTPRRRRPGSAAGAPPRPVAARTPAPRAAARCMWAAGGTSCTGVRQRMYSGCKTAHDFRGFRRAVQSGGKTARAGVRGEGAGVRGERAGVLGCSVSSRKRWWWGKWQGESRGIPRGQSGP
eukprot:365882-Chlamydomonas_euryale.AAC.1